MAFLFYGSLAVTSNPKDDQAVLAESSSFLEKTSASFYTLFSHCCGQHGNVQCDQQHFGCGIYKTCWRFYSLTDHSKWCRTSKFDATTEQRCQTPQDCAIDENEIWNSPTQKELVVQCVGNWRTD